MGVRPAGHHPPAALVVEPAGQACATVEERSGWPTTSSSPSRPTPAATSGTWPPRTCSPPVPGRRLLRAHAVRRAALAIRCAVPEPARTARARRLPRRWPAPARRAGRRAGNPRRHLRDRPHRRQVPVRPRTSWPGSPHRNQPLPDIGPPRSPWPATPCTCSPKARLGAPHWSPRSPTVLRGGRRPPNAAAAGSTRPCSPSWTRPPTSAGSPTCPSCTPTSVPRHPPGHHPAVLPAGRRGVGRARHGRPVGRATIKLVGAGIDDARLAEDLSRLVGEHDVPGPLRQRRRRPRQQQVSCAAKTSSNPPTSAPSRRARAAAGHRHPRRPDRPAPWYTRPGRRPVRARHRRAAPRPPCQRTPGRPCERRIVQSSTTPIRRRSRVFGSVRTG